MINRMGEKMKRSFYVALATICFCVSVSQAATPLPTNMGPDPRCYSQGASAAQAVDRVNISDGTTIALESLASSTNGVDKYQFKLDHLHAPIQSIYLVTVKLRGCIVTGVELQSPL